MVKKISTQQRRRGAQCLYTALGWRYRPSPRKRREVKRTDTRIPVPVPDPSLLIPFTDPHDLGTSWCLPDSRSSASVPVEGLAGFAFHELHRPDRVRQGRDLQLSSRRGWAATGGHPRTRVRSPLRTFFLFWGKVRKTFTRLICALFNTSWRVRRR